MVRDKHNSSFDPQYKQLDNTSTQQLWVWLHSKKQSKKFLLNPAKLASLLQKTGIVYMPIPLLPAAPERLLGDSGKLYILFSLWNKFWYIHKYEQTTILIKRNFCLLHHRQQAWNKQQYLSILTPNPSLGVGAPLDLMPAFPPKSDLIPIIYLKCTLYFKPWSIFHIKNCLYT